MSVVVTQCPLPRLQFIGQNGVPLAGAQLFTYEAGSSTPAPTYSLPDGSATNNNPIILDATGSCDCYLLANTKYKLVLAPANDTNPPSNPYWTVDQVEGNLNQFFSTYGTDTGSVNAYVVALNPPISSYTNGQQVIFDAANTNTGPSTINVNGLGPIQILQNGQPLGVDQIQAGQRYVLSYQSSTNSFLIMGSSSPSITAVPAAAPNQVTVLSQLLYDYRKATYGATGTYTWTVPSFVTDIWVSGCAGGGGGGAGGGANSTSLNYAAAGGGGGGGGAGQAAYRVHLAVTPGDILTITVGIGGTGGTPSAPATAGGMTTIKNGAGTTILTLDYGWAGGQGGSATTSSEVALGTGGSTFVFGGSPGGNATPTGTPLLAYAGNGGTGGPSPFGNPGYGGAGITDAGGSASGFGAGGGGGSGRSTLNSNLNGANGGNGGSGFIIIEW